MHQVVPPCLLPLFWRISLHYNAKVGRGFLWGYCTNATELDPEWSWHLSWFRTALRHSSICYKAQFASLHKHPPSPVVCFWKWFLSSPAINPIFISTIRSTTINYTLRALRAKIQLATTSTRARNHADLRACIPFTWFLFSLYFLISLRVTTSVSLLQNFSKSL